MDAKAATEKDLEATVSTDQTTYVSDPYGELHRGLKERHVQFIALGGTIGTGLFLGIGSALATSGPLSLFLGYLFTSVAICAMVNSACIDSPDTIKIYSQFSADAVPRGNDFTATTPWNDCPARDSLRGSSSWVRHRMESMV